MLSAAQLARVRELVGARRYDMAYAYYIRSAEALREARRARPDLATFMALQLSQTLNTERLARTAATPWDRLFYRFETRRMAAYEARLWQDVSRTVLIGEQDRAAIAKACREQGLPEIDNVVWGPHGVDVERFKPRPGAEEADMVVMSGVMRYAPNVEAALWFVREVWPLVRAERPQARFFLVGRDPAASLQALDGKDGITVTGTVEEPAEWIARAAVCVAPIRAAAGLQNKLLEAMAMAKAVVATPVANEGIRAPDGEAVLLAEEPAPFARAVLALLADPGRRRRAGCCRAGVRRGQVDLGGPVPGAGGGVSRHLTPDAASDRRPVFAALHNSTPCSQRLLLLAIVHRSKTGDAPMAKPTLPELKLPELKLPKFDLDALFGLQKANLSVAQETQSVVLEAFQAIVRLQHGYALEVVETLKTAAKTKEPAKPETVMADVKAAAEKAVAVTKQGVDLGVAAQQRVVELVSQRVKANVDELKTIAA